MPTITRLARRRVPALARCISSRRLCVLIVFLASAGLGGACFPTASLADCNQHVTFALVDATTTGCFAQTIDSQTGADQWQTSGAVVLNGVPVQAAPNSSLVLSGPSGASPGGAISLTASVTIAGFTLSRQAISQKLPAGGAGGAGSFVALRPDPAQKFLGLDISGSAVSWSLGKAPDGTGYSTFAVVVALPSILRNGPGRQAGGLTGNVSFRVDPGGVHTDAVKFVLSNAYIGALELKNLCLSYISAGSSTAPCSPPAFGATPFLQCPAAGGQNRWDGSALMVLPTASRPQLGLFAGISGGSFSYAGAQVANLGGSFPLATSVFLDKFGLGVCVNPPPFRIKGAAGIRFGPVVNGKSTAYLDGSLEYIDSSPWVINAAGALQIYGQTVGDGTFRYVSSGDIDFGINAHMDFLGGQLKVDGSVRGWYQAATKKYDLFGTGKVCAVRLVCLGGDVAVSSVGVAGCVSLLGGSTHSIFAEAHPPLARAAWFGSSIISGLKQAAGAVVGGLKSFGNAVANGAVKLGKLIVSGFRVGAGYKWGSGRIDPMGSSCDVGPYRAQKAAVTAAAGTLGKVKINLVQAAILRFKGRGAPPKVELTGPRGDRIMADNAGTFVPGEYLFSQDPSDNSTLVDIVAPPPGEWTVRALPGSAPIMDVQQATAEPPASATGAVIGAGVDRTLDYVSERKPGEEIQFVERASDGGEHVIGMAAAHTCDDISIEPALPDQPAHPDCGKIEFHPGTGPAGARKIVGVLMRNGEPVQEIEVATYDAPAEQELAAPQQVNIMRKPGAEAVAIQWTKVDGADTYNIAYQLGDGEHADLVEPGDHELASLPEPIDPADKITVSVTAVRQDETAGHATTETSEGQSSDGPPMPEPTVNQ
jgi:hypothetical protein